MPGKFSKIEGNDLEKARLTGDRLSAKVSARESIRNHGIAMLGEFVGTFLFLFFAFAGTQTANTPRARSGDQSTDLPTGPDPPVILYISLSFGVSLAANVWIFYRVSGGMFNPAVTFGLCLIGAVPVLRGILVAPAQIAGAIASAAVVRYLFPGPLAVTTSLNQATNITTAQGLFIEMFATAQLVFTIYMLAVEKHRATFLAPLGIGLSLFVSELAAVYYTGGSLNPARSLAPALINDLRFSSDHWIYWIGPLMGALLASGLYLLLKLCRYEGANAGQDDSTDEADRQLISMLTERLSRADSRPRLALRHMGEGSTPVMDSWGTLRAS